MALRDINIPNIVTMSYGFDNDYETLVIRGDMLVVDDLAEKKHALKIILNHLGKDPLPIFERNVKDDHSYDGVMILRMQIKSIIGKKYMG